MSYSRDMTGYSGNPPNANWPGGARIAAFTVFGWVPSQVECGVDDCVTTGTDWVWAVSNAMEYAP